MSASPLSPTERFREERRAHWKLYEDIVRKVERKGLRALSSREVEALPQLHQLLLSSLGAARSAVLDRALLEYLEALAARGHAIVHQDPDSFWAAIGRFLSAGFPRAVHGLFGSLLVSTAIFLAGMAIGWAACADDPRAFHDFVQPGLAGDRTPDSTRAELEATLYGSDANTGQLASFSAALFLNNSRVGLLAFALGLLFGLPTAFMLFSNGAMLGAFSWLFHTKGLSLGLWGWLLPHGVPEMFAIILCGAAGLEVARGFLWPGPRSRLTAIRVAGHRAALVATGAIALFLYAGVVEGVFRQRVQDDLVRYLVAAIHVVGLTIWLWVPRKRSSA